MAKSKPKAKAKRPASTVATIAAAAKRLGVHAATVKEWLADGCPGKRGAYDVEAIARWRTENRRPPRSASSDESAGRAKWEARKSRADALRKELEYLQARGRLIELDSAVRVMRQHVAEVRSHLEQLPDKFMAAVKVPPDEKRKLRARLTGWVRDYLNQFERSLRELAKTAEREAR